MIMRAKGVNCEVELFDHHIVIKRTGLFAAGSRLGGDKSVPLASITSVQFRRAGMLSPGFIKFGILGEADPGWDKLIHPNVVGFRSSQQMAFQRICDAVQSSINLPSLAALASQHVRERSARTLESNASEHHGDSGHERVLIDAPSLRLPRPSVEEDIDAALVHEPDWNAWGRRIKFLLKMAVYSIALCLFVGLTGLGRRLEGFDTVTLSGASFRLIMLAFSIAIMVALVSPIVRLIPLRSGTRLADWVRRAPRTSLAAIIFAIPLILVTGGPSPYSPEVIPDRQIVIKGTPDIPSVEASAKQQAATAVEVPRSNWLGKYDAHFDGATGEIEITPRSGGRLAISIGMAGERCAGGIEAVVDQPAGDVIMVAKAPYEDGDYQESACRLTLRNRGDELSISEDEVCMNHHGVSCGFEGTAQRASGN